LDVVGIFSMIASHDDRATLDAATRLRGFRWTG
jgi:hypothetical protein